MNDLLDKKAPEFSAPNQDNTPESLGIYKGSWVVLYFYPKDNTPGCTTEADMFKEEHKEFTRLGAVVLGVSSDTVESHKAFKTKRSLPFSLVSDTDKAIARMYGVWGEKEFLGKRYEGVLRTTFLISPEGVVAKVYDHVKPKEHAKEVLRDLERYTDDSK